MASRKDVEVEAVEARYARRATMIDRYAFTNADVLKASQERERALVRWATGSGLLPLSDKRLVEVGCGSGGNLLQMLRLGFRPENLVGNELLESRMASARVNLPQAIELLPGDASLLDLAPESFDVVFQSTVFTSLLDLDFQARLAARMWQWVRPGGGVLWYDFVYDNPSNTDVRGVPVRRVRELFPNGTLRWWRLTLAPPIARRVTRIQPWLYDLFNAFPFLRTHVLCWIVKRV